MEKSPNIKKSSPHSLCLGLREAKDRQAGGIPHVEPGSFSKIFRKDGDVKIT